MILSRHILYSTGIHVNWINCLLYKVLLNLHVFPPLNRNCTELYLGPLHRSYIIVQFLKCKFCERVLTGAICKRFSKVSYQWRCDTCHHLQLLLRRTQNFIIIDQFPVAQKVDYAIQRINLYSLDNGTGFPNTSRLDSDLSHGGRYLMFEWPGPGETNLHLEPHDYQFN